MHVCARRNGAPWYIAAAAFIRRLGKLFEISTHLERAVNRLQQTLGTLARAQGVILPEDINVIWVGMIRTQ